MTKPALIWTDLETTGLDPRAPGAALLEIALVITDADLNELDVFHRVFPLPVDLRVPPKVLAMHARSGLLEAIAEVPPSGRGGPTEKDDYEIADWLAKRGAAGLPLAGSTVSFDRNWLEAHLPYTADVPHYRNVDVSSIKELVRVWSPQLAWTPPAEKAHRSLDDVRESMGELRHYALALGWRAL